MNNFDGTFRRLPIQSLGGSSSVKTNRQQLIEDARNKREQRELMKRSENSAIRIQSWLR